MGRRYTKKQIGRDIELVPMCPLCRADIYWSLHSGVPGAESLAYCANNGSATRMIVDPTNVYMCTWEGVVRRNRDGSVDIFGIDGSVVPHRVNRNDQ